MIAFLAQVVIGGFVLCASIPFFFFFSSSPLSFLLVSFLILMHADPAVAGVGHSLINK